MNNFLLTVYVIVCVIFVLAFATALKISNVIQGYTARKIVHVSVGIVALLFLKFYGKDSNAYLWASFPTFVFSIVFYIMGSIKGNNCICKLLTLSTCRSNVPSEMKKGPFIYCLTMTMLIYKYYIHNPAAIIGMNCLILGDGLAEIIGKKFESAKLINIWGETKTAYGCLTVFLGSFLGSLFFCYYIYGNALLLRCLIGSAVGTATEFLAPPGFDNFFIPLPYIYIDYLFFSE